MTEKIFTKRFDLDMEKLKACDPEYMVEAMKIYEEIGSRLRNGELVAFPTETVYGLGANIFIPMAVKAVYEAKGRPSDNPMIVHISDYSGLDDVCGELTKCASQLTERFWPGPLTIVVKKNKKVSRVITGGLDTVAIRMPSHPVARSIIRFADVPVAAPSANSSGKPSPTKCDHVLEDLDGKIQVAVCCDSSEIGVESTVVDCTGDTPVILRPGAITGEMIKSVCGNVEYNYSESEGYNTDVPKSPGTKYRHYAPDANSFMYMGSLEDVIRAIGDRAIENAGKGIKTGILTYDAFADEALKTGAKVLSLGNHQSPEEIAGALYARLREFNGLEVDEILIHGLEDFENNPDYEAVNNRIGKATGKLERV